MCCETWISLSWNEFYGNLDCKSHFTCATACQKHIHSTDCRNTKIHHRCPISKEPEPYQGTYAFLQTLDQELLGPSRIQLTTHVRLIMASASTISTREIIINELSSSI